MSRRQHIAFLARRALVAAGVVCLPVFGTHAATFPVTDAQKNTAQKVAEAGVPLSELAPNAPDTHTVKSGDTLWDISKLFLKSPWRWPELWGMNLDQVRNPHLIYPGQVLYLEKADGRARLRFGKGPGGNEPTVRMEPRMRSGPLGGPVASIPLSLLEPFMNEAVIFETNDLELAPRIVATPEGSVLLSRGDLAYVRGDLRASQRAYRLFREPKAMSDPTTGEVLGYEANFVGTAEYIREAGTFTSADGKVDIVPATLRVTSVRQEAGVGDRLVPVPPREFINYVPHAPRAPLAGQIVAIYGEGLSAGQNQIVSLNRGEVDGIEPGYVLALWRDGKFVTDSTDPARPTMKLPDEREGTLFVFRVFKRMSYAIILRASDPVKRGDRFTQP